MEPTNLTLITNLFLVLIWILPFVIALLVLYYMRRIYEDVHMLLNRTEQRNSKDTKREGN